ncbi:MAG: LUD domain-containing protein, partial [Sulfuricaulis sp.]|nr:LUD domain-containing protein [Sulfuricaulis sp.]
MQVTAMHFKRKASENLRNEKLQKALEKLQTKFVDGRAAAIAELPNFEKIRDAATDIREKVIRNLDRYLLRFEQEATARGAVVHWAETASEVNRIVVDIARQHGLHKVVKSKSMVSEECGLNDALEAQGLDVLETDLGEYILQLAHEPPSHIVAPVVHKSKEEIADLFEEKHHRPRTTKISEMCREAREVLRP